MLCSSRPQQGITVSKSGRSFENSNKAIMEGNQFISLRNTAIQCNTIENVLFSIEYMYVYGYCLLNLYTVRSVWI